MQFLLVVILQSGEVVALKKVPLRKLEDGIPNTALRSELTYNPWSD